MAKINFINVTQNKFLKKQLYRFTTIPKVKKSLIDKEILFSKLERWNDPYERYFLKAKYLINNNYKYLPAKGNIFCLCLTERYNSEAYWKTYSPMEDGLKIVFNTEELLKKLNKLRNVKVYIGQVEYRNTNEFPKVFSKNKKYRIFVDPQMLKNEILNGEIGEEQIKLMLIKRKAFLYEEEIRIFLVPKDKELLNYSLKINISEIINKFYIDPRIEKKDAYILIDEFINYYNIENDKVGRSTLYSKVKLKKFEL